MKYRVVPTTEEHIDGLWKTLDTVARERRYLAFLEAPPFEETRQFVSANIAKGNPQFVAISDDRVIGWCDVVRNRTATHQHCGVLGMGLLPAYRGVGIGRALLNSAIEEAWRRQFQRIELGVRESNVAAISLYRKLGFKIEGVRRKAALLDGRYENTLVMGLLNDNAV